MDVRTPYVVAVHGGAGNHRRADDSAQKRALKMACEASLEALQSTCSATSAVSSAICVLEDDPLLNAGLGSNLTLDGRVECDAAIMSGSDLAFGSAAAVSGVRNPIRIAERLLENSRIPAASGLIPPMTLASAGALTFALEHDIATVPPEELITQQALRNWEQWKSRLPSEELPASSLDTVGAVALDSSGSLATGVSSGGLLLKHSGRVGQAAIYGAGCWAVSPPVAHVGVACSISGEGEHIIRASLARKLGEAIVANVDDAEQVIISVMRREIKPSIQVGVLIIVKEDDGAGSFTPRLWCAFTTESIAVGYASSLDPKPKTQVLRRTGGPGVFLQALPMRRPP